MITSFENFLIHLALQAFHTRLWEDCEVSFSFSPSENCTSLLRSCWRRPSPTASSRIPSGAASPASSSSTPSSSSSPSCQRFASYFKAEKLNEQVGWLSFSDLFYLRQIASLNRCMQRAQAALQCSLNLALKSSSVVISLVV